MPSVKKQPSNIKHGDGIRPNVWVLTFGVKCSKTSLRWAFGGNEKCMDSRQLPLLNLFVYVVLNNCLKVQGIEPGY